MVDADAVPHLVALLEVDDSVKEHAAQALGNIAWASDTAFQALMDANEVPRLVALLTAEKQSVQENVAGTLRNMMAKGDTAVIQAVVDANAIPRLVALLVVKKHS